MAVYIVDGDNKPGTRTVGIEKLQANDEIYIYYADNNKYYTSAKVREPLKARCKAKIDFISSPCGKNAVDFHIAIKAAMIIATSKSYVFLISEDTHFEKIVSLIRKEAGLKSRIVKSDTIANAMRHNAELVNDVDAARALLRTKLGSEEGDELFGKIEGLLYNGEGVKNGENEVHAELNDAEAKEAEAPSRDKFSIRASVSFTLPFRRGKGVDRHDRKHDIH